MLLGPIFSVELKTSARRWRHFGMRTVYAAILLAALAFNYFGTFGNNAPVNIQTVASFAQGFFHTFATLQLLAVVLLGPAITVGAISEERERRTIEYLFATDLSNAEIVGGKLAARQLQIGALVLAGLPILSAAMLLGGIVPEQLLLVFMVTLSTVWMVSAISLAISVWTVRVRDAVTRVYVILFALIVLPWMISLWQRVGGARFNWVDAAFGLNSQLLEVNPFWSLMAILNLSAVNVSGSMIFVEALLLIRNQLILGAACAALALWGVRRVHLKSISAPAKRGRWLRWRLWRPKLSANSESPMLWKELTAEVSSGGLGIAGRIAMGLILLGILALTAVFYANAGRYDGVEMFTLFAMPMSAIVACGGLLIVAARSAAGISSERERETWTMLINTPLTGGEILRGKIAGNCYAARGVWGLLALLWGLTATLDAAFLLVIPFLAATVALLAVFVSMVGLFCSLRLTTSIRAMSSSLAICLALEGGYLFCCFPCAFDAWGGWFPILSLWMPFLIVAPALLMMWDSWWNESAMYALSYGVGMLAYASCVALMSAAWKEQFDQHAGRIGSRLVFAPRNPMGRA